MISQSRLLHRLMGRYRSIGTSNAQNLSMSLTSINIKDVKTLPAPCCVACLSNVFLSKHSLVYGTLQRDNYASQLPDFIGRKSQHICYPARLYSGQNIFLAKDCESVDEVFQLAIEQGSNNLPTAAVWHRLSQILSRRQSYHQNSNKPERVKREVAQRELEIFDILLEPTMNSLDRSRPRDLATITLAMAKIIKSLLAKPNNQWSIDQRAFGNILLDENLKPQECIFQPLAEAANEKLLDCEPRDLSNLAYAYALLGNDPEFDDSTTMLEKIGGTSLSSIKQFNAQDISNMVWAFTTLKASNQLLFQSVGDAVARMNDLNEFKPQALANIVWSYGSMDLQHPNLFEKVGDHIVELRDLNSFNPQNLSNIIWAYATMNVQHPGLFKKVGNAIVNLKDLKSFNAQAFANIVWAYATANIQHPGLFEELKDLKSFQPQNLSNIVWAFATANIQHPGFKKVGNDIVESKDLSSFNGQDFSNTVWAYATANMQHSGLFKNVGDAIIALDDFKSFKPQELSNTVWAYATANIHHPGLFKKVGNAIIELKDLKSFQPLNLSNIVWAFATANLQHPGLFKKVGSAIAESDNLKPFKPQELANTAWAFAVSNVDASSLFNDDFTNTLLDRQDCFTYENLSQLYQWHLWQTGETSNAGLPEAFINKCHRAFTSQDTRSSSLQKDVVLQLTALGMNPVEEYETPSGYKLDALIEINGKMVGVEVDGPFHFINKQPNGRTLLKRRQVETIDKIPLVSVPYWEWDKLGKDRDKNQKYLKALVESL